MNIIINLIIFFVLSSEKNDFIVLNIEIFKSGNKIKIFRSK